MEKTLYNHIITEGTETTDIANQAEATLLAQNAISESLPYMISFNQPLSSSAGYSFGLQQKDRTSFPGIPGDDIVVIRKFIQTQVREVTLDLTNETAQDIQSLFGDDFKLNYDRFIQSGGELWDGPNGPLAKFFLSLAKQRMTHKINQDFINWLATQASPTGALIINTWAEMEQIMGALAEMREALFNLTNKDGRVWIVTSPKIANFLATNYGRFHSSAEVYEKGKQVPSSTKHGYVRTLGDIEIYQDGNISDKIYMGYLGPAGTSSVYYFPYNEYIIQGGEDYNTGQSNIFYRVRDQWETNPLILIRTV